jgi:hypothetical protein
MEETNSPLVAHVGYVKGSGVKQDNTCFKCDKPNV